MAKTELSLVVAPRRTLQHRPLDSKGEAKTYKSGEAVDFSEADIKAGIPAQLARAGVLVDPSAKEEALAPSSAKDEGPRAIIGHRPLFKSTEGPQVVLG